MLPDGNLPFLTSVFLLLSLPPPPPSTSTSPQDQFNLPSIAIIPAEAASLHSSLTTGLETEEAWRLTGCYGEDWSLRGLRS